MLRGIKFLYKIKAVSTLELNKDFKRTCYYFMYTI